MNLEGIMLSEINQGQKDKYVWSHLPMESNKVKIIESDIRIVITRKWGDAGKSVQTLLYDERDLMYSTVITLIIL